MSAAIEGRVGRGNPQVDPLTRSKSAVDSESEGLQYSAESEQTEQSAILESSSVESSYLAALASNVEAKHDQVERIEGRLEGLIGQQEAKLNQIVTKRPGMLALPGVRAGWQGQVDQQQALLQRLHGRLEVVREIKEGMGLHGPRVEELALRKLRFHERGLASDWDVLRAAQRGHQELMRRKAVEQQKQSKQLGTSVSESQAMVRGHSLNLSRSSS